MNILLINADPGFMNEFEDFATQLNNRVFFSRSTSESISILNDHPIDTVILRINRFADAAILRYINDYYRNTKVVIQADDSIEDILASISRARYTLIRQSIKLKDLSKMF